MNKLNGLYKHINQQDTSGYFSEEDEAEQEELPFATPREVITTILENNEVYRQQEKRAKYNRKERVYLDDASKLKSGYWMLCPNCDRCIRKYYYRGG